VSRGSLIARLTVAAAVFGLLLVGSFKGHDDAFPFGPFRMYATAFSNNGTVHSIRVDGIDDAGRPLTIDADLLGLRPAEFEGQLSRLESDPRLLDGLAQSYRNHQHSGSKLHELRLIEVSYQLRDGRRVGDPVERLLATGHAS